VTHAFGLTKGPVPRPIVQAVPSGQRTLAVEGNYSHVLTLSANSVMVVVPVPSFYSRNRGNIWVETININNPTTRAPDGDAYQDENLSLDGAFGSVLATLAKSTFWQDGAATTHTIEDIQAKGGVSPLSRVCAYDGAEAAETSTSGVTSMQLCAQFASCEIEVEATAVWDGIGRASCLPADAIPSVYGKAGDAISFYHSGSSYVPDRDRVCRFYSIEQLGSLTANQIQDLMEVSSIIGASSDSTRVMKMVVPPDGLWFPLIGGYVADAAGNSNWGATAFANMNAAIAAGRGFFIIRNDSATANVSVKISAHMSWNAEISGTKEIRTAVGVKSNPVSGLINSAHIPDHNNINCSDMPAMSGIGRSSEQAHSIWANRVADQAVKHGNPHIVKHIPATPTPSTFVGSGIVPSAGTHPPDATQPAKPSILDELFGAAKGAGEAVASDAIAAGKQAAEQAGKYAVAEASEWLMSFLAA